ncbi:MAG TPA: hypothetical protein VLF43_05300 [Candidatus Saccharimonadales bacterium]|nr:hypothetical protein [Candidatus Saccharimonadales bacterium]
MSEKSASGSTVISFEDGKNLVAARRGPQDRLRFTAEQGWQAEPITLADGIDTVATRYAEQYKPYQRTLMAGWRDWQRIVGGLGLPVLQRHNRLYRIPPVEVQVTARSEDDEYVSTPALVSVRGILQHVRHARKAIHIMQRYQESDITLLPNTRRDLWNSVHYATEAYDIVVEPTQPGLIGESERLRRPASPTRRNWMESIDVDGPTAAWETYTMLAEDRLDTLRDTMELFEQGQSPSPHGGGEALRPAAGFYSEGIQL